MIHSIVTSTKNSTYHHHDNNSSIRPLTIDHIIQNSYFSEHCSDCGSRFMGTLSWVENEQVASLNSRIDFINKITSAILEEISSRDTPITFVSLGSGGLLTESFIHKRLKESGYQDLNWRIIDTDYKNDGYNDTRKEFREQVNGKVKAFTTEQVYLNKLSGEGDKKLAESDKHRGAVVVLSINPPTIISTNKPINDSYLTLRGNAFEDVSKANAIYLMVSRQRDKEQMIKKMNKMYSNTNMIISNSVLKYSINRDGQCYISVGQSELSHFVKNSTETYLKDLNNTAILKNKKIKLSDIDQALDKCISTLPSMGAHGSKIFVSDYDNSICELNNFLVNSNNNTLFASFDKNQTSIESKK